MKKVRTVMGDVDPEEIGITLIHEHTYLLDHKIQFKELADFKKQGGSCVVDQTTIDLGRQPDLLKQLTEMTGLHVIASTGFYREEHHPDTISGAEIGFIADMMIREIEESIEGVAYKAGLIGEVGTTEFGTTQQEVKTLRASARAHLATGVTVSVHTMGGAEALKAIDILTDEGVAPQRIMIDHIDLDHVEHLRMVAERGVFLGFDTIGKTRYRDDTLRLDVLCAMVDAGYEDLIVLSHDISKPDYLKTNGGHGYVHLLGTFVPRLRERVSEETIEKFLINNPRRVLAF
ncbi:MAG TPA: phosphotriesterase [Anaerolineae bacterium]|nr:phosphotriesterase [Anaerolineae bacterium]